MSKEEQRKYFIAEIRKTKAELLKEEEILNTAIISYEKHKREVSEVGMFQLKRDTASRISSCKARIRKLESRMKFLVKRLDGLKE